MIRRLLGHIVVRNALVLFGLQISGYLLPLLMLPYLARVLSPGKFGVMAFAQNFIWYFVCLTEYGFNLTATRRIATCRNDIKAVARTFSAVMSAKALLTALGFAILVVCLATVPRLEAEAPLFLVCFMTVVGNLLFPVWLFQGLQNMHHLAIRDVGAKVLSLILLFLLVHSDRDYVRAAGIQSFSTLFGGLVSLAGVYWLTRVRFSWPAWDEVKSALAEGWPVFVSVAALTFCGVTNIIILGLKAPPEQVAYYNNAFRLIIAVRMLVSPLATALYPHISQVAAASRQDATRILERYSVYLSAPFFCLSAGIFVLAPWIIPIVYGPRYGPSVLLLRILSFSPFLLAFAHIYSTNFMLAFGFDKEWTRIVLIVTVFNFVLLGLLLSWMAPATAVAVTGAATDAFGAAAYYRFYRKHRSVGEAITARHGG